MSPSASSVSPPNGRDPYSSRTESMAKPLEYTLGVQTDVGQTRSHNEDTVAEVEVPNTRKAFILCDGMGGLRAGDVASKEAVRVVGATLRERFAAGIPADPSAELLYALTRANTAVNNLHSGGPVSDDEDAPTERRMSSANPDNALMGTTCVACVVLNDELYVAHAGDSRAYLWRGGRLTPLTNDHSWVGERVRSGDITEAEARVSRFRNIVTQAIGIAPTVEAEARREPLQPGDAVLVCSDGLTTELEDVQIADLLRANPTDKVPADRVSQILIDAANRAGGHDNISVILLVAGGVSVPLTEAAPVATGNGARRNGATAQRMQEDYEEEEAPRSSSSRRSSSRRSSREAQGLPLGAMAAGAALLAAIVGAMLLSSPSLSRHAAHLLLGNASDGTTTPAATPAPGSTPNAVNFAALSYDAPKRISETALRGDALSYAPGSGLLCVAQDAGTMMLLSKDGKPIHSSMGVIPSPAATGSASRLYVATDGAGDIYLSSAKTRSIEKRGVDGKPLKTIKGLDKPEAIAVDETGNIYVIDANMLKVIPVHPSIGGNVPVDAVAPPSKYGVTDGVAEPSPSAAPASSDKPKKKVVAPSASPKDGA